MKLGLTLFAAINALKDSDYTFIATNNGAVSAQTGVTQCTQCDVTGATTVATYTACHTQNTNNGKETCPTEHDLNQPSGANAYVCGFSAVKNAAGEVVSLKTGCMRHNDCLAQNRQNYVGGIARHNQCKPNPQLFGRFRGQSKCNTCFPMCDGTNCFDADTGNAYINGIYDGTSYKGAWGDETNMAANAVTAWTPAVWQPGYWINQANSGK